MEAYPLSAAEWNDSKIVILSGGEAGAKDLTSMESLEEVEKDSATRAV